MAAENSWVLGLSAIQLAHDDNDSDTLELADLEARGLVSETLEPHPRVPGNPTERAALGALHANCGHCHNSDRPTRAETRCFDPKRDFDLWLTVDALESPESTPTYQTAIDGDIIDAGKPGLSELISRVNRRGFIYQMPPLGSEQIDTENGGHLEAMDRFALKLLASVVVLASSAASAEPVLRGLRSHACWPRGRALPTSMRFPSRAVRSLRRSLSWLAAAGAYATMLCWAFESRPRPSLVEQPGGSYIDDKTFGNPEISALRQGDPRSYRGVQLRGSAGLAIGVPIAGHGPNGLLTKNRALAISSAIEGWSNQALYVPSVIPITPAAALHARRRDALGSLRIEIPMLIRIGDASAGARANTRSLAVAPHVALEVGALVAPWCTLSLTSHLAAELPAPIERTGGHVQLSVEPRAAFSVGSGVELSIDVLAAVGGPLAGTAGIGFGLILSR